MSSRDRIKMSEEERLAMLGEERVVVVTSLGPRGWPHSMPMWFVVRDGDIWIWTYDSSQKVRNLERDPRATLLIEAGGAYEELRGVMIEAEAEIEPDPEAVVALGRLLGARYGDGTGGEEAEAALRAQACKRVAIHFRPVRTVTWDHRKL
jgi:PPOX class probable F420-dependent enzyme